MALWQLLNLGTGCTVTHCWIALWSHESAQTASSERSSINIYIWKNRMLREVEVDLES